MFKWSLVTFCHRYVRWCISYRCSTVPIGRVCNSNVPTLSNLCSKIHQALLITQNKKNKKNTLTTICLCLNHAFQINLTVHLIFYFHSCFFVVAVPTLARMPGCQPAPVLTVKSWHWLAAFTPSCPWADRAGKGVGEETLAFLFILSSRSRVRKHTAV